MRITIEPCCDKFLANLDAVKIECYLGGLGFTEKTTRSYAISLGDSSELSFCPWCGVQITVKEVKGASQHNRGSRARALRSLLRKTRGTNLPSRQME